MLEPSRNKQNGAFCQPVKFSVDANFNGRSQIVRILGVRPQKPDHLIIVMHMLVVFKKGPAFGGAYVPGCVHLERSGYIVRVHPQQPFGVGFVELLKSLAESRCFQFLYNVLSVVSLLVVDDIAHISHLPFRYS